MNRFRLAFLASCFALPALAQEVPAIDKAQANARAVAQTNANAVAEAQGRVSATATAQAVTTGMTTSAVPRTMPPPIVAVSPDKPLTHKEAVGVAVAQRWIQKFQTPHLDPDGVLHFVSGKGQVFIVTAVDHLTDIALAPGETIFPPLHVGDSASWKFHPANSRTGGKSISHILVKPIDAGLSTNMVIETNKRTISVSLSSRARDYMPLVSLDLPEDEDADFTNYAARLEKATANQPASTCDQSPVVPPQQFTIDGDRPSWRPIQVYQVSTPVGIKTCVDFPSDIGSTSLPALLALADDGGWFSGPTKTVVNVRFVNRRFIVDEALSRFVLVDGVGSDQKSIRITRKNM
jgi:P-type conjugative transfer protein TrbG